MQSSKDKLELEEVKDQWLEEPQVQQQQIFIIIIQMLQTRTSWPAVRWKFTLKALHRILISSTLTLKDQQETKISSLCSKDKSLKLVTVLVLRWLMAMETYSSNLPQLLKTPTKLIFLSLTTTTIIKLDPVAINKQEALMIRSSPREDSSKKTQNQRMMKKTNYSVVSTPSYP